MNTAWPARRAVAVVDRMLDAPRGARRAWTAGDQLLVDEANSLLDGTPFTYGHVVVDEAQDHSAVALRVIGRRVPAASLTVLGDLAQSSTPAGQRSWDEAMHHLGVPATDVAHLTIGYRVPAPILDVANRLLPRTGVDTVPGLSARTEGHPPAEIVTDDIAEATAEIVAMVRRRHALTGIVAPTVHHQAIATAVGARHLTVVDRVQPLADREIPMFTPEQAKGLEFDAVVVVDPHSVLAQGERGARLLYVALTRAVRTVNIVTDRPLLATL
jgi:DNA helicase IV